MGIIYHTKPFFIKSKSLDGEMAKQYFSIASRDEDSAEKCLLIQRYILTKNEPPEWMFVIKTFNNYYLVYDTFGIKITSLKQALKILKLWKQH